MWLFLGVHVVENTIQVTKIRSKCLVKRSAATGIRDLVFQSLATYSIVFDNALDSTSVVHELGTIIQTQIKAKSQQFRYTSAKCQNPTSDYSKLLSARNLSSTHGLCLHRHSITTTRDH